MDHDIQKALNHVFSKWQKATGLPKNTQDYGHVLLDDEVGKDSWFCPSHSMATLAMI